MQLQCCAVLLLTHVPEEPVLLVLLRLLQKCGCYVSQIINKLLVTQRVLTLCESTWSSGLLPLLDMRCVVTQQGLDVQRTSGCDCCLQAMALGSC